MDDKKTLTIEGINDIFAMMDDDKKQSFNKNYIEELYLTYMSSGTVQEEHKMELRDRIYEKTILLIAPGKSSVFEREKIIEISKNQDVVAVSVNHVFDGCDLDYIFLSNLRRYREWKNTSNNKIIVTSNIPDYDAYLRTKYVELLNDEECVSDNAGLMAIKFFMLNGAKKILLAGFDGYSHDVLENYGNSEMSIMTRSDVLDAMNLGMSNVLRKFSKKIELEFVTKPKHVHLEC